jgi:hypothetical protein
MVCRDDRSNGAFCGGGGAFDSIAVPTTVIPAPIMAPTTTPMNAILVDRFVISSCLFKICRFSSCCLSISMLFNSCCSAISLLLSSIFANWCCFASGFKPHTESINLVIDQFFISYGSSLSIIIYPVANEKLTETGIARIRCSVGLGSRSTINGPIVNIKFSNLVESERGEIHGKPVSYNCASREY